LRTFWIALELRSSEIRLIITLSLPVTKLIAFKKKRIAKSGNADPDPVIGGKFSIVVR